MSSLRTKLRIASSVLFATGFFDALAGRFLLQRAPRRRYPKDIIAPPADARIWRDLRGALHVHSTYSDGKGDIPCVMEAACDAGVDWVLLTDHNTQRPRRDDWEADYDAKPVLLIGTEVTVEQGAFLLALDMPPDWEPTKYLPPQAALDEINARGGLPLVSLPFDVKHPWCDWDACGYVGLEVINLSTVARRHINVPSLLWLLPLYKRHGMLAVLRALVTRPDREIALWDRLMAGGRRMVGIAALDAHALMKIGKNKYPIPSYADSFRAVSTHVLVAPAGAGCDRPALYAALRAGRCYLAYDCLGEPTGFRFTATNDHGEAVMGERIRLDGSVRFRARAPRADGGAAPRVLLRLLCDGKVVAAAGDGQLVFTATTPGVYRVEAYRYARRVGPLFAGARPWIFSNPIYVHDAQDSRGAAVPAGTSGEDSAS